MSFKKNLIICVLLVVMLMCCVSAVSASEDSSNMTLDNNVVSESDDILTSDVIASESDDTLADESNDIWDDENTIYVDSKYTGTSQIGTSENPYKTITAAINGATSSNPIIYIKNGTYSEKSIDIPAGKGFSFIGESTNGVVIKKNGARPDVLINVNLNNVNLSFTNLTFTGLRTVNALNIGGSGNLDVINCIFNEWGSYSSSVPSGVKQATFTISTTSSTFKNTIIKNINVATKFSPNYIEYKQGNHIIDNVTIDSTMTASINKNAELYESLVNIKSDACVEANNFNINNINIITSSLIENSGKLIIKDSSFTNNVLKTSSTTKTVYGLFNVKNGNLSIESSLISDNKGFDYFIYETGKNTFVNLESCTILNNNHNIGLLNPSGTTNLNYNWWGTNNKPNDYVDYWIFKDYSVVKDVDYFEVNVDLTKYTDGNTSYNLEKSVPTFLANFKLLNFTTDAYSKDGIATAKISNDDGDFYVDVTYVTTDKIPLRVIYVDCNFNGTELGTIDNPYKSISKAVEQSTGWEMIHIKNGNYVENNQITLINSLNFLGESQDGVIITGSNKGIFNNPFYMNRNIVLLFNNLTFKDVACTSNNAALSIGKSVTELNITNCIFDNCSGQWGSMSISNSNLNMDNCKILNSKSTTDAGTGAIYFNGEGDYRIKNTLINNTESVGEYMVGIIVSNQNNASITLDNVQITNTVSSRNILSGGKLNVKNSKIQNNNKINNIFNITSNFTLETSVLSNNEIIDAIICNNDVDSVTVNYNAILDNETLINKITSCNFDYNWWGTNDKPNEFVNNWVIYEYSVIRSASKAHVNIYFNKYSNGTDIFDLSKNVADGIEAKITSSTLDYDSIIYSKNGVIGTSFAFGDNQYVNITFDYVNITEYFVFKTVYVDVNSTENGTGTIDNPYNSIQKAIDNTEDGDTIIVKNGSYSENIKWTGGKGVNIYGESKDTVLISLGSNSNIDLNIAKLSLINLTFNGGSAKFQVADGDLNIVNCTFNGMKIYNEGIFSVFNSNSNIENCKFLNLNVEREYAPSSVVVIYSGTGNHYIKNSIINNVDANQVKEMQPKAILNLNGENAILDIDNLTISNNDIEIDYIIYINSGIVNIKNSKIINNYMVRALANGEHLFGNNGQLNVESSIISDNFAVNFIYSVKDNSISNVNYNVLKSNTWGKGIANTTGNINLDYNWWESNYHNEDYADVDANTWIILDAYYTQDNLISGENVTVVATLNHYITKNGEIGEVTKFVPIGERKITFTLGDGTVLNKTTVNGETNFTYTIKQSENVTIKSGEVEVILPITLKTVRIDLDDNYTALEDASITINAPGINANVTLIIDGKSETVEINNTYIKTIENIQAGTHSVVAIYNNGGIFEFDTKSFTVDKLPSEIIAEDVSVYVGEATPIIIDLGEATGRVYFDLSGKKSFTELEDGKATLDINDLAIGNYTLKISYGGDAKYLSSEKTVNVTANGLNSNLKANASDIKVGENAIINVEISKDVTGKTSVILGDLIVPVTFADGKATVEIPNLKADSYTATVRFAGDGIFLADEINVTFTVSKEELPSDINVSTEIPEGTTAPEFTINLPSDATGNFTVTVDGTPYTEELVNGSATVKVPEQTPGNHTISTSYSGDDKYDGFTSDNKTFDVPKASIPGGENALNMTTPADSATPSYSINLPNDATGNLTVTVDGKDKYSQALVNGSATVTLPELQVGKHDITVAYSGDDKYSGISKTTSVNVPEKAKPATQETTKAKTIITAKKKTYKAKTKVKKYTITLKSGKKPVNKVQVTLKIKGKTYKAKTNAKGKATFKIKKLTKKGKYSAVIKFAGNKNYKATSKKVKITVKK